MDEWMSAESLAVLRMTNAAWKLLASDDAAFCCAFFYAEFLQENARNLPEEKLVRDLMTALAKKYGEAAPEEAALEREARERLKTWANGEHEWIHRFYSNKMPCIDLTTPAQKAVEWLRSLKGKPLVGTESRLHLFFHLLHEIEHEANPDRAARKAYLLAQKEEIEKEIAALDAGGAVETLSPVQVKERFLNALSLAQEILSDFREVKDKFQEIYEKFRQEVNEWQEGKGGLLERFLEDRDLIESSEQGKSFRAFFEYLMTSEEQQNFEETARRVLTFGGLTAYARESELSGLKDAWLDGAADVEREAAKLSEQMSWYVNERHLEEKRQIYYLVREILKAAGELRGNFPKDRDFMTLPEAAPTIDLPMERPLRLPPVPENLSGGTLTAGEASGEMDALFHQIYVDKQELRRRIREMKARRAPVTLAEIIGAYPVEAGLLEILTYLEAARAEKGRYVPGEEDTISYKGLDGKARTMTMERIVFENE